MHPPVIDAVDMMPGHNTREPETAKQAQGTSRRRNVQEAVRTFNATLQSPA